MSDQLFHQNDLTGSSKVHGVFVFLDTFSQDQDRRSLALTGTQEAKYWNFEFHTLIASTHVFSLNNRRTTEEIVEKSMPEDQLLLCDESWVLKSNSDSFLNQKAWKSAKELRSHWKSNPGPSDYKTSALQISHGVSLEKILKQVEDERACRMEHFLPALKID